MDALAQIAAQLQADLPTLLEATENQPDNQKFIQGLVDIITELNTQGEASLSQLIGKMDPQSLDTLERSLRNEQENAAYNVVQPSVLPIAQNTPLKSSSQLLTQITGGSVLDGDLWLTKRKSISQITNTLNTTASIAGHCNTIIKLSMAFAVPAASQLATVAAICTTLNVTTKLIEISTELAQTASTNGGSIKNIHLNISALSSPAQVISKDSVPELIKLEINNADNNQNNPSSQSAKVTGATLSITHIPDLAKATESIKYIVSSLIKLNSASTPTLKGIVQGKIESKLFELATSVIDKSIALPSETKVISLNSLSHNCPVPVSTKSDGTFVVPDQFNYYPDGTNTAVVVCDFKINADYLLPSESNIYSRIDFSVKKYAKLILHNNSSDPIGYSKPSMSSKASSCAGGETCIDYFLLELPSAKPIQLTAKIPPGTGAIIWTDTNGPICDDLSSCSVTLDRNNVNVPEITFSPKPYPPHSEVIGSWAAYESWYSATGFTFEEPSPRKVPGPMTYLGNNGFKMASFINYDIQTFKADMYWDREQNYTQGGYTDSSHWSNFTSQYYYDQNDGTIQDTYYGTVSWKLSWKKDHWILCSSLYTLCAVKQ